MTKLNIFLRFAVITFCIYIVVVLFNLQIQLKEKRAQLDRINAQIAAEEEIKTENQRFINSENKDEYIERMARDKLGFARPDERVFYNIGG